MYMLDTCILVDFLRGRSSSTFDLLRKSDASLFKIPSIVKAELLLGAEKSNDPSKSRHDVESTLLPYEIVPFDDQCAYHYARTRGYLEQKGQKIGDNDNIIAATALAHSAVLVTRNVNEFKRIPGLTIEEWAEVDY